MSGTETVADIVAGKRARANEIECAAGRNPNQFQRELIHDLRTEADRIEAAWKRDERHALEHATAHAEAVARGNCRDCIYNPQSENYEGGNAAAMREALKPWISMGEWLLENAGKDALGAGIAEMSPSIRQRLEEARAALSAPPRNCDIGTAKEQEGLYDHYCHAHLNQENCCDDCPLSAAKEQCEFAWSQMPYESEATA